MYNIFQNVTHRPLINHKSKLHLYLITVKPATYQTEFPLFDSFWTVFTYKIDFYNKNGCYCHLVYQFGIL